MEQSFLYNLAVRNLIYAHKSKIHESHESTKLYYDRKSILMDALVPLAYITTG